MNVKDLMKPGDLKLYSNGRDNVEKLFDHNGKQLKIMGYDSIPCHPHGVNGPNQTIRGGDTVESIYKLGLPIWTTSSDDVEEVKRPYGHVFIPMIDVQGNMHKVGRDGFGIHGGGAWEDYWNLRQVLRNTLGCNRHWNEAAVWIAHLVEKLHKTGNVIYNQVDQPGGEGQV